MGVKHALDFFAALTFVLLFWPLIAAVALIVRATSSGPAFFKQRRVGANKKEFTIYKFRTMRTGTPDVATHLFSGAGDYVTKVGKVLRKSSLDEIPQVFNILKGEMSFIGPRPALHNQHDLTGMREAAGVHRVRPGITGWAQVNGRDELALEQKVQFDKYYVDNWSFLLDIKIIIKTVKNVFTAKGVKT